MATKLLKEIHRELLAELNGKLCIITLEPGDLLTYRFKGTRTRYAISLHQVFTMALMAKIEQDYKERMKMYKVKIALGHKRIRKPKRPTIAVFSKRLRQIYETRTRK